MTILIYMDGSGLSLGLGSKLFQKRFVLLLSVVFFRI